MTNHKDALTKALEALKPFAEAFNPKIGTDPDPKFQAFLDRNEITPRTTMGDFRRAHEVFAALSALQQPDISTQSAGQVDVSINGVEIDRSAEYYLRGKYGAYRGHFAWRELEEAFNAGKAAQPAPKPEGKAVQAVRELQTAFDAVDNICANNDSEAAALAKACDAIRPLQSEQKGSE